MNDNSPMGANARDRHCEEVEQLMRSATPFVTRHGVTIVVAIILATLVALFMTDGEPRRLAESMIEHVQNRILTKSLPTDIQDL